MGRKSLTLSKEVNLATPSSAPSAKDNIESGRAFQSLMVQGKRDPFHLSILAIGF